MHRINGRAPEHTVDGKCNYRVAYQDRKVSKRLLGEVVWFSCYRFIPAATDIFSNNIFRDDTFSGIWCNEHFKKEVIDGKQTKNISKMSWAETNTSWHCCCSLDKRKSLPSVSSTLGKACLGLLRGELGIFATLEIQEWKSLWQKRNKSTNNELKEYSRASYVIA